MDNNEYGLLFDRLFKDLMIAMDYKLTKFEKKVDMPIFGKVTSVTDITNANETITTTHAVVETKTALTDSIRNMSGERLYVGDSVKLTATGGNLGNSYISLRCANQDI